MPNIDEGANGICVESGETPLKLKNSHYHHRLFIYFRVSLNNHIFPILWMNIAFERNRIKISFFMIYTDILNVTLRAEIGRINALITLFRFFFLETIAKRRPPGRIWMSRKRNFIQIYLTSVRKAASKYAASLSLKYQLNNYIMEHLFKIFIHLTESQHYEWVTRDFYYKIERCVTRIRRLHSRQKIRLTEETRINVKTVICDHNFPLA